MTPSSAFFTDNSLDTISATRERDCRIRFSSSCFFRRSLSSSCCWRRISCCCFCRLCLGTKSGLDEMTMGSSSLEDEDPDDEDDEVDPEDEEEDDDDLCRRLGARVLRDSTACCVVDLIEGSLLLISHVSVSGVIRRLRWRSLPTLSLSLPLLLPLPSVLPFCSSSLDEEDDERLGFTFCVSVRES